MLINIGFQSPRKKGEKASLPIFLMRKGSVVDLTSIVCLNWPVKAELSDGHNDHPSPQRTERDEMKQNHVEHLTDDSQILTCKQVLMHLPRQLTISLEI